ncbi:unnamed protein product [Phyllotreta striolata]|uniref:Uncharacterized protein n=1 Tax=Phyllotreta striolata TaxID=444603 RepID=A0A9N9TV30_PHYSR|nr:unnamed protein product [Phyllotreta striolata]
MSTGIFSDPIDLTAIKDITPKYELYFIKRQYDKVTWNDAEAPLVMFRKRFRDCFFNYSLPFSLALILVLRRSVFGTFLDALNPLHNEASAVDNKFAIIDYEIKHFDKNEWQRWKQKNRLFDNMYGCLKHMVTEGVEVTLKNLEKILQTLRICNTYMNSIDSSLKDFKNLQILQLSDNNLRDINGSHLPRNLKILELNNNFISNVDHLTTNAPKRLLYLGLGRNCLNNNSSLHLLSDCGHFQELCCLDLSQNDIYDLNATIKSLSSLHSLDSLLLEGNPCYMDPFYIYQVCHTFKKMAYLDNTQILKEDKYKMYSSQTNCRPVVFFHCYRLMGIQKPTVIKGANLMQTFHVEISLPLLESVRLPSPPITPEPSTMSSSRLSPRNSVTSVKKSLRSQKSVRIPEPLLKNNQCNSIHEYNPKQEERNHAFKTVKKTWSPVIEFPQMAIEIPNDDLILMRDTLRSTAKVDIVYSVISRNISSKSKTAEIINDDNITIESKMTLASFTCNLETWNWSDQYLDFFWDERVCASRPAVKVNGSLKNLNYTGKKKLEDPTNFPQTVPKNMALHFGFEMARNLFQEDKMKSNPCIKHSPY